MNVVMKVAGSSRPRIRRKKLGYRFVLSRVQTQRPGSDRLALEGKREGRRLCWPVSFPCHRTRLGVFLAYFKTVRVPSQAFVGARCEAQLPAGVGGQTQGTWWTEGKQGPPVPGASV